MTSLYLFDNMNNKYFLWIFNNSQKLVHPASKHWANLKLTQLFKYATFQLLIWKKTRLNIVYILKKYEIKNRVSQAPDSLTIDAHYCTDFIRYVKTHSWTAWKSSTLQGANKSNNAAGLEQNNLLNKAC